MKAAVAVGVALVALAIADIAGWEWVNSLGAQQIAMTVISKRSCC